MNRILSFVVLLTVSGTSQDITLADFLEMSYMKSEQIEIAKLDQKKRMSVLEERKGDFLPVIKASANYAWIPKSPSMVALSDEFSFSNSFKTSATHPSTSDILLSEMMDGVISGFSSGTSTHSLSMGIEVTQPIWAQGKLRKAYEIARLEGRAAICDWQEAQMNVKANATRLFYQGLLATEFLSISKKRLQRAEERHAQSTTLFSMNMNSRLDTLNSFLDLSTAKTDIVSSKNSLRAIKKRMVSMAHMDIAIDSLDLVGELKEETFNIPYQLMEEQTLAENKILTRLSSVKEISELIVEMERGAYFPSIYAGVSINGVSRFGKSADFKLQPDRKIFLSAEIELYSFNRRIAKIRQAEYDMRIARETFNEQEREIRLALETAYKNYTELKEGLASYRIALESAKAAMVIAEERFKLGQMSSLDIQGQENMLLQSEYNLASAIFACNSALIDLRLILADYIYEKE